MRAKGGDTEEGGDDDEAAAHAEPDVEERERERGGGKGLKRSRRRSASRAEVLCARGREPSRADERSFHCGNATLASNQVWGDLPRERGHPEELKHGPHHLEGGRAHPLGRLLHGPR